MTCEECLGRFVLTSADYSVIICGSTVLEVMSRASEGDLKNCTIVKIVEGHGCDNSFICSVDENEAKRAKGLL